MKTEPDATTEVEVRQEPVIAAGSTGGPNTDHDNSPYKQDYNDETKHDPGHDSMEGVQDYGHVQREERPIGIKEDGYVLLSPVTV